MASTPEVGAQCGNSARWDLCGGARKSDSYCDRHGRDVELLTRHSSSGAIRVLNTGESEDRSLSFDIVISQEGVNYEISSRPPRDVKRLFSGLAVLLLDAEKELDFFEFEKNGTGYR